ncbi:MAG: formylglycine-generating enzyme family protein [Deltaproteobacteria bacterium]|nr:formylglycine-generating enzyme family protein [Deltaproteobacteria bacterium]
MRRTAGVMLLAIGFSLMIATSVVAGRSGIWKPADGSNNFYIQTYSTGSCVVIVTPDGEHFQVFLDGQCGDEVVAFEYFGRPATLDLAFATDQAATADLVIEGKSTQYTLEQVFEGDCRSGDGATGTITNSLGMAFAYIPPGRFTMGSPERELGRFADEPRRLVTLTQGFYLQTTEVTQGQWKALMDTNPSFFNTCGDDCPVESVSWDDAQAFIVRLNSLGEGVYRLPTEAEWEYAARARSALGFANGEVTERYCGLDPNLDSMGWYCHELELATHPVAQKTPNAWGLYDMHGNLREWCLDWYGAYPTGPVTDPLGPSTGTYRVLRSGSWSDDATSCRSASRGGLQPNSSDKLVGLRVLRSYP